MALKIKETETDLLARRLAEVTGETITASVKAAVRDRRSRELRRRDVDRIQAIVRTYQRKPVVDAHPAEDALYGEDGLPV